MEGLGLGPEVSSELDVRREILTGAEMPKLGGRTFGRILEAYSALNTLSDEELGEVIKDCRAGKWSKKLPGKPWFFGFLSKKKRDRKYLYLFEFSAAMRKYERQACENILNNSEIMGKIRDTIFKSVQHGCGEELKENAPEGEETEK